MKGNAIVSATWKGLRLANSCAAPVLSPLAFGAVALLAGYYGVEQIGSREPPDGWLDYIPKSPGNAFVILLLTAGTAFVAFVNARRWPTVANAATILGIATALALTWGIRQCDPTGGIVAGVTAAGIVVIIVSAVALVTGKFEWGITTSKPMLQSQEFGKGMVLALQIGTTIFMGWVVLIAVFYDNAEPATRPLLLVFAGVGLASASAVTAKCNLRNGMTIAGMVVSLAGAFMQVNQAGDVTHIVSAATLLALPPFAIFAYRIHKMTQIPAAALLSGVMVMSAIVLATMIPAVLITRGCNVADQVTAWMLLGVFILAVAGGIAASIITIVVLIFDKKNSSAAVIP